MSRAAQAPVPRLVTIGLSHYCEKARWGLERLGQPYREEPHPPAFHVLAVRRAGGRRTAPVLVTPTGVHADSTDILLYADARVPPGAGLYPLDPAARREVLDLEDRFDEVLGPHSRRLAYYHLLFEPWAAALLLEGVGAGERLAFRLALPLVRRLMRRLLRLDAAGAERSRLRVHEVFEEVDARLADGRPYLVGDAFTAADLTFAALAAPLLLPPEYGAPLPRLEQLPAALRVEVDALRARPAGQFGLRIYAQERRRGAPSATDPA